MIMSFCCTDISVHEVILSTSSPQLQKSGIIYLLYFVYLLHIVHSVLNLKLFSFHHSLIFFSYGSNIWIIDWLVFEYEEVNWIYARWLYDRTGPSSAIM